MSDPAETERRIEALLFAAAALARIARHPEPFDADEARARFDAAFDGTWAA